MSLVLVFIKKVDITIMMRTTVTVILLDNTSVTVILLDNLSFSMGANCNYRMIPVSVTNIHLFFRAYLSYMISRKSLYM